jgi:hypothetical protein
MAGSDRPFSFEEVLKEELELIERSREGGSDGDDSDIPVRRAEAMTLAGLAFSGGGIRSATFNLGFIQGLANRQALHLFDYLSTVSGGGYIGGWLSSLIHRQGEKSQKEGMGEADLREMQSMLATRSQALPVDGSSGFPPPEGKPVRFLRRYANYLTPELGLSGDTLALISIVLRNLLVMQFIIVTLLLSIFSLFLALMVSTMNLPPFSPFMLSDWLMGLFELFSVELDAGGRWLIPPALLILAVTLFLAVSSQCLPAGTHQEARLYQCPPFIRRLSDWLQKPNLLGLLILVMAQLAGVLIGLGMWLAARYDMMMEAGNWVYFPAFLYAGVWILASWRHLLTNRRYRIHGGLGMLAGAITFALILDLAINRLSLQLQWIPIGYVLAFAPIVSLLLYSLVITVHQAIAGNAFSEQQREWWARIGGQGLIFSLSWALAFSVLIFVPPLIHAGAEGSVAGGGLWAILTWMGARIAQGGSKGELWREVATKVAPWLFIGVLVGIVAFGFAALLPQVAWEVEEGSELGLFQQVYGYLAHLLLIEPRVAWQIFGVALGLLMLLLIFVDLNLFSAHSFYRNRLSRTFLGASREQRSPHPFTGFDPADDLPFAELSRQRPYHLVNATLNLTGGDQFAWQTRRGASFLFTPRYCGYSTRTSMGRPIGGYRPTHDYGDAITLGTAMAVSGAAASPNMGYHSAPSVAAFLTACNLRLARWCPNTTSSQWRRDTPRFAAMPLFSELFGQTGADSDWLNLSDGGHFDNLGLFELVRRRVRLILVTDIGADGGFRFDDLAMIKRKLVIDFGVELDISADALNAMRPGKDGDGSPFSERAWAVGEIHYPDSDGPGYIIYVKSVITRDAPIDIRQYRDANPTFPHQTTTDQWFDEDQFEAYRHLGQLTAERLCDQLLLPDQTRDKTPATAVSWVRELLLRLEQVSNGTQPSEQRP